MGRYRRNIDEDIRDAERNWVQNRDHASGVSYAKYLLRAGHLELTQFPLAILHELFPDGVAITATLHGALIGNVLHDLDQTVYDMMQRASADNTQGALYELSRQYKAMYGMTTVVWFPDSHELSCRYNWKRFDRQSVRIRDGEIDEESLSNHYAALQVDFTLPGHATGNPPFFAFHHIVSLEANLTEYRGYYDRQVGRSANYLVIVDEIPSNWDDNPRVSYGRCEDAPCCGHDICPPREADSGVQLAMSCTCGNLVPRNASSSLCEGCLRGVRREAYYGEDYEEPLDDGEDGDDDGDDEDEDEDGWEYQEPGLDEDYYQLDD
jgi:hypothetical protein